MSGEYDFVQKGALKLKGVSDGGIKKKKKKSKKSHKDLDEPTASTSVEQSSGQEGTSSSLKQSDLEAKYYSKKTKSEVAFLKRKEQADTERIKNKAQESHKERVEKFNAYLNSLSEHYEPAKVSWTK